MTKAERDELRGAARDTANKSQRWMVIDLPALLSLLDAADERDAMAARLFAAGHAAGDIRCHDSCTSTLGPMPCGCGIKTLRAVLFGIPS